MTTTQLASSSGQTEAQAAGAPEATHPGIRRAALVAGVGLLAMAILAPAANFGAIQSLVSEGDAKTTAENILASEGLFRLGIGALVVVVILDIVVAWALLAFFKPVHQAVSTLAAWLRLSYAAIFAVAISQLIEVLPLLRATRT
jgi:hypothetical protein